MCTNSPSATASTYSNRKCCVVQTGIFSLIYQCNKYNLLKYFIGQEPCYWLTGSTHLLSNTVSETFSSWQCWNPVISKDFDILKKQIPVHVTKWNQPSSFGFDSETVIGDGFHQIRESGFSFTCEAGSFTETETGTSFYKWITPSSTLHFKQPVQCKV